MVKNDNSTVRISMIYGFHRQLDNTLRQLTATALFLFLTLVCLGQDTLRNQLSISSGYPLPASMTTFKTNFVGKFSCNVNYERILLKHFIAGGGISYALFKTNTHLDSKMNVITASGNAGYKHQFLKKMEYVFGLKAGYSEMLFRSKDFQSPDDKFNESGFSCSPIVIINYHLSKKTAVGINTSYDIIFKHFGDSNVSEDPTIRFFNFGIGFIYLF